MKMRLLFPAVLTAVFLGFLSSQAMAEVIWRQGARIHRRLKDPFLQALSGGLLAYMAIMTFSNFFTGSTQAFPVVDLYFWFFAGLLLSLENNQFIINHGCSIQEHHI